MPAPGSLRNCTRRQVGERAQELYAGPEACVQYWASEGSNFAHAATSSVMVGATGGGVVVGALRAFIVVTADRPWLLKVTVQSNAS